MLSYRSTYTIYKYSYLLYRKRFQDIILCSLNYMQNIIVDVYRMKWKNSSSSSINRKHVEFSKWVILRYKLCYNLKWVFHLLDELYPHKVKSNFLYDLLSCLASVIVYHDFALYIVVYGNYIFKGSLFGFFKCIYFMVLFFWVNLCEGIFLVIFFF